VNECKPLPGGQRLHRVRRHDGGAVQLDPFKPKLKPPATKRLELIYDGPLSNFTFNFNLRRCMMVVLSTLFFLRRAQPVFAPAGRGLHSFTLELNLSNSRTHS